MPTTAVGFQVGLELTKILPVRPFLTDIVKYTLEQFLSIARSLRNSGSDLLVEEDLAAILGKVWVDTEIARKFKDDVLRNTAIVPISNNCALELRKGAGPTLERAFRDQEKGYLATVIQLSLLSWTHDRKSLASALSHCLNKRFDLDFPGASPSPGFDGLMGVLEACSSQANAFLWSEYTELVRTRIHSSGGANIEYAAISLPSNLLLTCLDSLYVIQRMPEEYTLTISEPNGCITLIVWAHHLLGLSVLLRLAKPSRDVLFSEDRELSPNIIIDGTRISSRRPEICLLDRKKEVQLCIDPLLAEFVPMEAQERLPLRGYGSVNICRQLGESASFKESPDFKDAVEYAVAMSITLSRKVARIVDLERKVTLVPFSIEQWELFDAAALLFPEVTCEEAIIIKYADSIPRQQPLLKIQAESLPCALRSYLASKKSPREGITIMGVAAIDLLVMATVAGIGTCGRLPLIAENDFDDRSKFVHKLLISEGPIPVAANDFFSHICWRLTGLSPAFDSIAKEQNDSNVFMASEFGWTLCLPSFGDNDPARVKPETLYIREGIPTDKKTLERKNRVRDALAPSIEFTGHGGFGSPPFWIVDNGVPTYKPRCVSSVTERSEFYGAREDGFHLTVKFKGEHVEPSNDKQSQPAIFEIQQSYRAFHDNLWSVLRAPCCEHSPNAPGGLESASLPVDVATAAGNWSWQKDERFKRIDRSVPERIVVVLVKGDPRARWLAVGVAIDASKSRRTMLRGSDCCEACAVEAAAKLRDKWFVII